MQTLTAGSFLNLENSEAVEALKFTARRLAEASANVVTENLPPASLENLGNNLWEKAEYVTRETERRRLRQIFNENFSERFRELKPEISAATNSGSEVSLAGSMTQNVDSIEQPPVASPQASSENPTAVEGKRDEFLGFVNAGDSFGNESIGETDVAATMTAPEKVEQENVHQAANETISETLEAENQTIVIADALVSENKTPTNEVSDQVINPNVAESQKPIEHSVKNEPTAKSEVKNKTQVSPAAADGHEPFEFGKCKVNLNLILLPCSSGKGSSRKVILAAASHNSPPEIDFLEIADGEDLTEVANLVRDKLARFKQTLPAKYIEQLRHSKTKAAKKPLTTKTSVTASAPSQPAKETANAERTSGEAKPELAKSATEENKTTASTAFVPRATQTAAANEIQGSLF